jgi:hypothetical protein
VFRDTMSCQLGNVTHSPSASIRRRAKMVANPCASPVSVVAADHNTTPAASTKRTSNRWTSHPPSNCAGV